MFTHVLGAGAAIVALAGFVGAAHAQAPQEAGKRALERNPDLEAVPGSVLVKFSADMPAAAKANARAIVAARNSRAFEIVPGLESLQVGVGARQAIVALRALPGVEYAEPDYVLRATATTPDDEFFGLQWGMHNVGQDIRGSTGVADADIDMIEAWDVATGDPGFVIAVIDTGTQWDHADLAANIWSNTDEIAGNGVDDDGNGFVDDVRGWDFFSGDNNPTDEDGHGSHVSGTIGAVGNNGLGVAGVMWSCQIMPLRFIGPAGGATSDAISAIEYAVANGATISNNSWGGGGFSTALRDAIAAAGDAGHLFVAAAGNSGNDSDITPEFPAAYDLANIISVANTTKEDLLAGTSNFGAVSVDLGAPGTDIASTFNADSFVWLSGTSMASPHVTGVAALLWSQNPSWTLGEVKNQLLGTVRPVAALDGKTVTGGVVNAFAALTGSAPPPPAATPDAPSGISAGDNGDGTVTVSWIDNSGDEDGFEVQREQAQKGRVKWGQTTSGTVGADVTSVVDDPGAFDTFRYRVRAFNSGGSSAWTAWAEVTVADPAGGDGGGGGNNGGGKGGGPKK